MKRVKVIVRAKLVVGYWEFIPLKSWDEFSAPHDTSSETLNVAVHVVDLDGSERKICCNCVNELWMVGTPKKLKMVQHRTVYRTDELE